MRVEEIEIHVGKPDFQFDPVRRLEAKCEAPTAMSKAPTIEDVNAKLREMAAGLGANAVIEVRYESGATMTSWRSMRGSGLAIRRVSDERPCPRCAEVIKKAATVCRFCGAELQPETAPMAGSSRPAAAAISNEPLRSTDNPRTMTYVAVAFIVLTMFVTCIANS